MNVKPYAQGLCIGGDGIKDVRKGFVESLCSYGPHEDDMLYDSSVDPLAGSDLRQDRNHGRHPNATSHQNHSGAAGEVNGPSVRAIQRNL